MEETKETFAEQFNLCDTCRKYLLDDECNGFPIGVNNGDCNEYININS